MKIAISSAGNTLDDQLDLRFGRAAMFIIYDLDHETFTVIDNTQNLNAVQGAGIQSAQHVVNSGAQALVTGHTGPKAYKVIEASKIPVYLAVGGTVREAIAFFRNGTLKVISEADVEGHWV